jgi:hypothetical protein
MWGCFFGCASAFTSTLIHHLRERSFFKEKPIGILGQKGNF